MNYVMIAARPEEEDPYHVVGGCAEAMKRLGAEALVSMDPADLERCDGLILPGGLPDVDPSRYGEALDGSLYVDAELDRQQGPYQDHAPQGVPHPGGQPGPKDAVYKQHHQN